MIISTGNMAEERRIVRDAIYHWNEINSEHEEIVFKVSGYDLDVRADSGVRPQESINKQIVEKSDFAIVVLWNRLGKETGGFKSGSDEEIQQHLNANKKVFTYFSKIKVDVDDIDVEQFAKFKVYKAGLAKKLNYKEFDSYDKLKSIINDDLTIFARELKQKSEDKKTETFGTLETKAKKVDINYSLQTIFQYGGVPEINQAFAQQIPVFKTQLSDTTKEIIINHIAVELKCASGDFVKFEKPMKLLNEYYDFIQNTQLDVLEYVLDEFVNICSGRYYSYAAEVYTRAIFDKITIEQYKIIRKMYMAKMLNDSQYIHKYNPIVEKFLDYTSEEKENNDDENEIRRIILKQRELWNKRPLDEGNEKIFDDNRHKLEKIKAKLTGQKIDFDWLE